HAGPGPSATSSAPRPTIAAAATGASSSPVEGSRPRMPPTTEAIGLMTAFILATNLPKSAKRSFVHCSASALQSGSPFSSQGGHAAKPKGSEYERHLYPIHLTCGLSEATSKTTTFRSSYAQHTFVVACARRPVRAPATNSQCNSQ